MLGDRSENKFGFEAEWLKVCSAAKRMFAVFRPISQYWQRTYNVDGGFFWRILQKIL